MEFPYSFSVEHSIECSNFINIHFINFSDFGNFPHRTQREEVIVLFLSHVEKGDDGRSFPVGGVFLQQLFNLFVVFGRELKGG